MKSLFLCFFLFGVCAIPTLEASSVDCDTLVRPSRVPNPIWVIPGYGSRRPDTTTYVDYLFRFNSDEEREGLREFWGYTKVRYVGRQFAEDIVKEITCYVQLKYEQYGREVPVHLIGHSLGAKAAAELSFRLSELPHVSLHLLLIDPVYPFKGSRYRGRVSTRVESATTYYQRGSSLLNPGDPCYGKNYKGSPSDFGESVLLEERNHCDIVIEALMRYGRYLKEEAPLSVVKYSRFERMREQ